MASIAIMIATPQGRRLLAKSTEREAALAAESVLRRLPATVLLAAVWVQCADPDITRRLTVYLVEVQAEIVGM